MKLGDGFFGILSTCNELLNLVLERRDLIVQIGHLELRAIELEGERLDLGCP